MTFVSAREHTSSLTPMEKSWRTLAMGSTLRDFTLNITNESLHFLFCFSTFVSKNQRQHHQLLVKSHPEPVRDISDTSGIKLSSTYETTISCLISQFRNHFPLFTSIHEPWHDDASVYGPVLVSHFLTATHAGFWATAHWGTSFLFLYL